MLEKVLLTTLLLATIFLVVVWSWVGVETALTKAAEREYLDGLEDGLEDDDDDGSGDATADIDGNNHDDQDPGDWWKTKSGRARNGRG